MKRTETVKRLADRLAARLLRMGITVHRYDAYSTESIYLKLDYGVCNSIRISGHPGKEYLKYRYNIGPSIQKRRNEMDGFPRYYYPDRDWQALLDRIELDRARKIGRYGVAKYRRLMKEYRDQGRKRPGFWQQAYRVGKVGETCLQNQEN